MFKQKEDQCLEDLLTEVSQIWSKFSVIFISNNIYYQLSQFIYVCCKAAEIILLLSHRCYDDAFIVCSKTAKDKY